MMVRGFILLGTVIGILGGDASLEESSSVVRVLRPRALRAGKLRHASRARHLKDVPQNDVASGSLVAKKNNGTSATTAHGQARGADAAAGALPEGSCAAPDLTTAREPKESELRGHVRPGKLHRSVPLPGHGGHAARRNQDYVVQVPEGYDPRKPVPVVMAFHGWGGSAMKSAVNKEWQGKSDALGALVVSIEGIGDYAADAEDKFLAVNQASSSRSRSRSHSGGGEVDFAEEDDDWTSWGLQFQGEVGDEDEEGVPGSKELMMSTLAAPTCTKPKRKRAGYCYKSCTPHCTGCSWTTCEDTVGAVLGILKQVRKEFCVDVDKTFAVGYSNGGMFVYTLARDARSAPLLAAVASIAGSPLRGFPTGEIRMPVLAVWGAEDLVMPPKNAEDDIRVARLREEGADLSRLGLVMDHAGAGNSWLYQSMASVVSQLRSSRSCGPAPPGDPVAWKGASGGGDLHCETYTGCEASLVHCLCEDCAHRNIVQKVGAADPYWEFFLSAAKARAGNPGEGEEA